jgi:hypothetical protein
MMKDTPPYLQALEEIEQAGIPGLLEVLREEGTDDDLVWRMNPRSPGSFGDGEVGFYTRPFVVGEIGRVCLSHAW